MILLKYFDWHSFRNQVTAIIGCNLPWMRVELSRRAWAALNINVSSCAYIRNKKYMHQTNTKHKTYKHQQNPQCIWDTKTKVVDPRHLDSSCAWRAWQWDGNVSICCLGSAAAKALCPTKGLAHQRDGTMIWCLSDPHDKQIGIEWDRRTSFLLGCTNSYLS